MADVRQVKIPAPNGTLAVYPVKDARSRRDRKNITNSLGNLSAATAEQNLVKYGYDIGDYFNGPSGYLYILADPNTFYGGYNTNAVVNVKHLGIVVDCNANVQWNTTDVTTGGYAASNLHKYLVETALPKIQSDFTSLFGNYASHLLANNKLFSNSDSGWAWVNTQYISALTSVQLHGAAICDMNFFHTGEGNKPLEVFQRFWYPELLGNQTTWLRSVASAGHPCGAGNAGHANGASGASSSCGAVGLILFH